MASNEFDKYLNSLPPEEKEKLGNIGKGLKEKGTELTKDTDTSNTDKTKAASIEEVAITEKAGIQQSQDLGKEVSGGQQTNTIETTTIPNKTSDIEGAAKTTDKADVQVDNTITKPANETAVQQGQEAAAPVKEQVQVPPTEPPPTTTPPPQQRNNEFTKLDDEKPKDQQPAEKQKDQEKDR